MGTRTNIASVLTLSAASIFGCSAKPEGAATVNPAGTAGSATGVSERSGLLSPSTPESSSPQVNSAQVNKSNTLLKDSVAPTSSLSENKQTTSALTSVSPENSPSSAVNTKVAASTIITYSGTVRSPFLKPEEDIIVHSIVDRDIYRLALGIIGELPPAYGTQNLAERSAKYVSSHGFKHARMLKRNKGEPLMIANDPVHPSEVLLLTRDGVKEAIDNTEGRRAEFQLVTKEDISRLLPTDDLSPGDRLPRDLAEEIAKQYFALNKERNSVILGGAKGKYDQSVISSYIGKKEILDRTLSLDHKAYVHEIGTDGSYRLEFGRVTDFSDSEDPLIDIKRDESFRTSRDYGVFRETEGGGGRLVTDRYLPPYYTLRIENGNAILITPFLNVRYKLGEIEELKKVKVKSLSIDKELKGPVADKVIALVNKFFYEGSVNTATPSGESRPTPTKVVPKAGKK